MAGRETILTPKLQAAVCKLLAEGNTRLDAAALSGIGRTTFFRWLKIGKEAGQGRYWEFRCAVLKAESQGARVHVANVKKAGPKDWRASAWWLERRRPKQFGRRERVALSGALGLEHSGEIKGLTDAQREQAVVSAIMRLGLGHLPHDEPADAGLDTPAGRGPGDPDRPILEGTLPPDDGGGINP